MFIEFIAQLLRRTALVCAGAAAITSSAVAAEDYGTRENQLLITPMVSYFDTDSSRRLDETAAIGLGVGWALSDRWTLEGVAHVGDADRSGGGESDFGQYRADLLYALGTYQGWVPYVAAGLGVVDFDVDALETRNDGLDSQFNFGVGMRRFFTDELAIRGDVRGFQSTDGEYFDSMWSLGLMLALGGQPRLVDSDGDGVHDNADRCPGTAAGVSVDTLGCPEDTDRDGVWDVNDRCPDTPRGTAVDDRGCPLDSDGDGVLDAADACPGTPAGATVDARGCEQPKVVSIDLYIEFDFDKATIRPSSHGHLDAVVQFLNRFKSAEAALEGHTDSRGDADYNMKLSQARAMAVRAYLVGKGIDADRIAARGYGETRPAASNDTEAGRQKNRRVTAVIESR